MFDKENNPDMSYIDNICPLWDMHDNDDKSNPNGWKIFRLVEHHSFLQRDQIEEESLI